MAEANEHPNAFQAALNLMKGTTESLVSKVEEAALSTMVSSILGGDERLTSDFVKKDELKEEARKVETGKSAVKSETIPREKELELERLRGEVNSMKERLSLLALKMSESQETYKRRENLLQKELQALYHKYEDEKKIYGREIFGLTQQVLDERQQAYAAKADEKEFNRLKNQFSEWENLLSEKEHQIIKLRNQFSEWETLLPEKELEIVMLKNQVSEWENLVSEKELEIVSLKNEVQLLKDKLQNQNKSKQEVSEEEWGINTKQKEFSEELRAKKSMDQDQDQEFKQEEGLSRETNPDGESKKEEGLSDQVPPSAESQEDVQINEDVIQGERQNKKDEISSYDEPLLTPEEIAERLKHSHHHGFPVPAKHVGGKRVKQNLHGPHVTHKSTLVEQRDEKTLNEQMGDSAEETSSHLAKLEKQQELALKEEQLEKIVLHRARNDLKIFPSTYFPPEPQNENQKRTNRGGMNTFQPPMHGKML